MTDDLQLAWRAPIADRELADLHATHGDRPPPGSWDRQRPHSLGWVGARSAEGSVVGFVNVAWDGGVHAFLLDTVTHPSWQRRGVATAVVALATERAAAAGCAWLHVDHEPHLTTFYRDACGFRPTDAGLIRLTEHRP